MRLQNAHEVKEVLVFAPLLLVVEVKSKIELAKNARARGREALVDVVSLRIQGEGGFDDECHGMTMIGHRNNSACSAEGLTAPKNCTIACCSHA